MTGEERKSIDLKLDPDDDKCITISTDIELFDDGTPEQWVQWRQEYEAIVRDAPLKTYSEKVKAALAFLKGRARANFQGVFHEKESANVKHPEDKNGWKSVSWKTF